MLSYSIPNIALGLISSVLFIGKLPADPKCILINRVGNLGDIVTIINSLYSIRVKYPNSNIVLLSSSGSGNLVGAKDVIDGSDLVDDFIVYNNKSIATISRLIVFYKKISRLRIDLWIELPNDRASFKSLTRNLFFSKIVGSSFSIGWKIGTTWFLKKFQAENILFPTETKRISNILSSYGIAQSSFISNKIFTNNSSDTLKKFNLYDDYIIISPAGKRKGTNLWGDEKFAQVANRLCSEYSVVFVGSKDDIDIVENITKLISFDVISLVGKTSVRELFEIIQNSKLCICVDSGVQHMAVVLGVNSVSLFSAWQYNGKWFPDGVNSTVIRKDVTCKTCLLDVCNNNNQCMRMIGVDEVMDEAKKKLNAL